MSLGAPRLGLADVVDVIRRRPVSESEVVFAGRVWDVRSDTIDLGDAGTVVREYVAHPGAVAVLAVREDRGEPEILLIRQYRHPVGAEDWELPAGLLDVPGEPPVEAARRELAEEVDLVAGRWEELTSFTTSPGGLDEVITLFVASDLTDVADADRHVREHEEAGMPSGWVPLSVAVQAVLGGQVRNAPMMLGVLALAARRR
ncbi:NUDIX domain-containing protein [Ornithinimicrobium cavernae]|uniref:NUDIX domain-containing protein n=1 Tax=Ornithinimicrobium cavernae TaxID=2666047 RepID=UPI000D69C727|nr:NUDIX hydrolase [Ornithinimicrobium cavernae]